MSFPRRATIYFGISQWFTSGHLSFPIHITHIAKPTNNSSLCWWNFTKLTLMVRWKPWRKKTSYEAATEVKQPPRCSVRKCALRNFAKFAGRHLSQSLFFNKVFLLTLLKRSLWHRSFLVNFANFLRKPSYRTTLGDCLWC